MRKLRNLMLTATIVTAGTLGAGSLFAQGDAPEKAQPSGMQGNMMDKGGMHGNMMGQMGSMMEKCHAMMETMQNNHFEDS